jgi:signal transduction histidine kinase
MKSIVFCKYNNSLKVIERGSLNEVPEFCKHKQSVSKCKKYYDGFAKFEDGLYLCPYGFATYKKENVIITCLRIKGYSAESSRNRLARNEKIMVYRQEDITTYLKALKSDVDRLQYMREESDFLAGLIHDFKKYNRMKLDISEELANRSAYTPSRTVKYKDLKKYVCGFQALSYISKARLDTYRHLHTTEEEVDYDSEPVQLNVFRTFDKLRHCGKLINRKDAWINVNANETIPDVVMNREVENAFYLLIDNALKYTETKRPVDITLKTTSENIIIEINSLGPRNSPHELERIFLKGFRGENARRVESDGQGIGLYTAEKICDRNNVKLKAKSKGEVLKIRDTEYCIFSITIEIPKKCV